MANIFTVIISSILYLVGGQIWKPARWLIGFPISLIWCFYLNSYIPAYCALTYYIATSWFPYGEKSWLNFLGERGKFLCSGIVFGLASIPALGLVAGGIQAMVSGLAFFVIKILDDHDILKNPFVEAARGALGTIVFLWA